MRPSFGLRLKVSDVAKLRAAHAKLAIVAIQPVDQLAVAERDSPLCIRTTIRRTRRREDIGRELWVQLDVDRDLDFLDDVLNGSLAGDQAHRDRRL